MPATIHPKSVATAELPDRIRIHHPTMMCLLNKIVALLLRNRRRQSSGWLRYLAPLFHIAFVKNRHRRQDPSSLPQFNKDRNTFRSATLASSKTTTTTKKEWHTILCPNKSLKRCWLKRANTVSNRARDDVRLLLHLASNQHQRRRTIPR